MIRGLFPMLLAALMVSGCGRADFETADAAAFTTSCVAVAQRLASALAVRGFSASATADVILMSVESPTYVDVARRFDPGLAPPVAGADVFSSSDAEHFCGEAAAHREGFEGIGAWTSFDVGLTRWLTALTSQATEVHDVKNAIRDVVDGRRVMSGRLADLIGQFAPRGIGYAVMPHGGRSVPTITIEAVNPLDKPIQAMFLAIDLRRPDGSILASGRLTFTPAAALNPGVEAQYSISLDGVAGFGSPALADLRDNVSVGVKVEDLVSDNVRLLNDTLLDPQDGARIDTLAIVQGRIDDIRAYIRRIREREAVLR